ncbi:hypothetical protein JCM8208_007406 [Rhodotorula glutinis]
MAAPPAGHALRGLNSQQAAQAVAAAYRAAGLRTDDSPAARERFVEQQDEWLARFSEWLEPDWWAMWPEAEQDALLDELERARAGYASAPRTIPYEDEAPRVLFASPTLVHMRTTFCRLAHHVYKIGQSSPTGADHEQWRLDVKKWFREGVASKISAWEFDDEDEGLREQVLREFFVVRCELDEPCPPNRRLHALPSLDDTRYFRQLRRLIEDIEELREHRSKQRHAIRRRERGRVNADLDRFRRIELGADRREEEAEYVRAFARSRGIPIPTSPTHGPAGGAGAAHSLAHMQLSPRQHVVYGRARARY